VKTDRVVVLAYLMRVRGFTREQGLKFIGRVFANARDLARCAENVRRAQ
jgi:hypothetical protein